MSSYFILVWGLSSLLPMVLDVNGARQWARMVCRSASLIGLLDSVGLVLSFAKASMDGRVGGLLRNRFSEH